MRRIDDHVAPVRSAQVLGEAGVTLRRRNWTSQAPVANEPSFGEGCDALAEDVE
jgi:hypothetical protein